MEHAAHSVDILDANGKVIGKKRRRDINKAKDIYHAVFVLLVTPKGEVVLSAIPQRTDLPNLYARQLGATMATIRRSGETALQAAIRGVEHELFINKAGLRLLGEQMVSLPDGIKTLMTAYYMVADAPQSYSVIDIDTLVVVTPQQIRNLILNRPNEIAPTLKVLWETYSRKLPV